MPHNERFRKPIVSGINEERKILPARLRSRQESDRSSFRVIDRSTGVI